MSTMVRIVVITASLTDSWNASREPVLVDDLRAKVEKPVNRSAATSGMTK